MPADKLLILGASSKIGRCLYDRLGPDRAIGTYCATPLPHGRRFDILTMRVKEVVRSNEANHAVILLANTKPDSCFQNPTRSRELNVVAMQRLISDLWDLGTIPIFASSDCVFDGVKGDYVETDEANPILLYGQQKKDVEDFLAFSGNPHLCFRIARVYGNDPDDGTLLSTWVRELTAKPSRLRCAADQTFSPIYVGDVAAAIIRSVECGLEGLYHLCGNRRFTHLSLLKLTVSSLARRQPVEVALEPCSINDFNISEKRPLNISMRNDQFRSATDFAFQDVSDSIEAVLNKAFG